MSATEKLGTVSLVDADGVTAMGNATNPMNVEGTVSIAGTAAVSGTVAVSASALPTGASTSARQDTEIASLASIDGKLPALSGGRVPVVLPAGGGGLTDAELRASPVPVRLRGDPTWYVWVEPQACAANKYFLALLNTGAQVLKLRKLYLQNAALTAVTGVGLRFNVGRVTAIGGGTAVTPQIMDSSDAALTGLTCVHTATGVTDGPVLFGWFTNNDEIGLTGGFPQATIQGLISLLPEGGEIKEITLRQGEGVCLKQITASTVGSFGALAVLTLGA